MSGPLRRHRLLSDTQERPAIRRSLAGEEAKPALAGIAGRVQGLHPAAAAGEQRALVLAPLGGEDSVLEHGERAAEAAGGVGAGFGPELRGRGFNRRRKEKERQSQARRMRGCPWRLRLDRGSDTGRSEWRPRIASGSQQNAWSICLEARIAANQGGSR